MPCLSARSTFTRRLGAVALTSVVLATAGCGAAPSHSTNRETHQRLGSSGSVGPLAPCAARRAAVLFARSYLASRNDPRHPVTTGAAPSLADQLRVNSHYLAEHPPARRAQLLGVTVEEVRAARVVATALLSVPPSSRPLRITFALRPLRSRWLAVSIRGNAA